MLSTIQHERLHLLWHPHWWRQPVVHNKWTGQNLHPRRLFYRQYPCSNKKWRIGHFFEPPGATTSHPGAGVPRTRHSRCPRRLTITSYLHEIAVSPTQLIPVSTSTTSTEITPQSPPLYPSCAMGNHHNLNSHSRSLKEADPPTQRTGGLSEWHPWWDVCMHQPQSFVKPGEGHLVCKLHKSLYGLRQNL